MESALLKLAKSMGMAPPSAPKSESLESIDRSESKENDKENHREESEEGELSETEVPFKSSLEKPSDAAVTKKEETRKSAFTGEHDAETLLRGTKPPKVPAKRKPGAESLQRPNGKRPIIERRENIVKHEKPKLPCKYWLEGKCSKGDQCTYSHAAKPLKTAEEAKVSDPCRYYMLGSCLRGDQCLYSHDLSNVPCKFFHVRGECAAGSSCRYSHKPIEEDQRRALFVEMNAGRDPRLPSTEPAPVFAMPVQVSEPYKRPALLPPMNSEIERIVKLYNPFGSPF